MPKISSIPSARPSCAYDSLLHDPLQQSQIDAIYAFRELLPVCDGKDKDIYNTNQVVLWLSEALLRQNGHSTMERPKVDQFETRGRTIYDTQPINFDTHTPSPQTKRALVRRLSEVIESLEKLAPEPETPIFPIENVTEFVTPPRRARQEARAKPRTGSKSCLDQRASSPSPSRSKREPDSPTVFLAITKKGKKRFVSSPTPIRMQKAELMWGSPEQNASIPNTPESCMSDESIDSRSWSRSPTPSLSWSVSSANSSPGSIRDEDGSGPEMIAIEPINYLPELDDAVVDARNKRLNGGEIVEAEIFDDSFKRFFEMFVNAEDEVMMSF